jgi:hypothetical protein
MLFVMEKPLIGRSGARLQKSVLGNFDRSTSVKISIDRHRAKFRSIELNIRSIDFPGFPNFRVFLLEILSFLS